MCFWNLQNFSVNAKRSGNERNIACEEHRKGSRTNRMGTCVKYCKDIVLKYCSCNGVFWEAIADIVVEVDWLVKVRI